MTAPTNFPHLVECVNCLERVRVATASATQIVLRCEVCGCMRWRYVAGPYATDPSSWQLP